MIVEKQVLEVISWNHPNYQKFHDEQQELLFGGGFYLHGDVERHFGYDLCSFIDLPEEFTYPSVLDNENHTPCRRIKFTGIYPIKVLDYPNECLGFFWFSDRRGFRGLIVDKIDFESLQYANEQYLNKEEFI